MPFVADLHIHSKYSRACSRDCDLEHLAWWAGRKGISVVGTGDFTHPAWSAALRDELVPAEPGLFRLRDDLERAVADRLPPSCRAPVRFMLSVEISTIYKRGDRTRKVHHLLYAPSLEVAGRITASLARIGNLAADGRPILGLDSRDLLEITLEAGEGAYLVPAHLWTPWFAVLGSKSGFDAVEDCYADLADHIFALETGLSSDPEMNWRVSALDRYRLVSNSDAHSPPMLGREATRFDTGIDYFAIRDALATGDGFAGTIEFFPEEGKYHLDGHRKCGVRLAPAATREAGGDCPACAKPLTVGVLHRVEALADRPEGARAPGAADFRSLVALPAVLGELLGVGPRSRKVAAVYDDLVARLGPELGILAELPLDQVTGGPPLLGEALGRLRAGQVQREAGYDGEYGVIRLFDPDELKATAGMAALFEPPPPVAGATADQAPGGQMAPGGPAPTGRPTRARGAPVQAAGAEGAAVLGPLAGLDPEQRAAAEADGPLLIVAGPGSGKTRTLTRRLAYLVAERGVAPEHCLAITFTRRAGQELRERLDAQLGDQVGQAAIQVATFHGLGLTMVRERHEALGLPAEVQVAGEAERIALLAELAEVPGREARRLLGELAARKRGAALGGRGNLEHELLERYDAALRQRGLVDFDDLLTLPVRLLDADPVLAEAYRARWPVVAVDEYQDVDAVQYRLLRLLAGAGGGLTAIGDPDQAIYGFRGADVGFFLRFGEDFPGARTVTLGRNYRSSAAIVAAAVQAVAPATLVPGRELTAAGQVPGPGRVALHRAASEQAEAEFVVRSVEELLGGASFHALDSGRASGHGDGGLSFADVAVLYRTDAQAGAIADALAKAGMPFQKRSHDRATDRPGVQAVLDRLRFEPAAEGGPVMDLVRLAAERAGAAGGRTATSTLEAGQAAGMAHTAVELLAPLAERCGHDLARFLDELALGAEVDTWDPRADRISLLTLHASKGLEFPVVFLVGCDDGLLPLRVGRAGGVRPAADLAEERRLLFVGMTRARSYLFLSGAGRRARHGAVRDVEPSPFLADIDPALLDRLEGPRRRAARPAGDQLSLL